MNDLVEHIVYLAALLADRPRRIDRHVDYFGGAMRPAPAGRVRPVTRTRGRRRPPVS
jgi:hypothetical protein